MIDTNKIYTSNQFGLFKISKYINASDIIIEFLATGYKASVQSSQVNKGSVKDKLTPSVYGVGYLGDGTYVAKSNGKHSIQYKRWADMLQRCYSVNPSKKNASYLGCTVCAEWFNFQVFAKWFDDNYIDGMQLDKDIKIDGSREYSPKSCSFVTPQLNSEKAHSKNYEFTSPQGELVKIYNLTKFCRENCLSQSAMLRVNNKVLNHHKKWTRHQ